MTWSHKPELKDSLVDMYRANPKVNEELKQRLPSPIRTLCVETTSQLGLPKSLSISEPSQSASEVFDKDLPQVPPPPPKPPKTSGRGSSPLPRDRSPDTGRPMDQDRPSMPRVRTPEVQGSPPGTEGHSESPLHRHPLSMPEVPSAPPPRRGSPEDPESMKVVSSGDSARLVPALDKEKNIAFLLKELDSLRDLNKKLQDKLALREKELETKLLDTQLQESQMEALACDRAGALVEEIYKAQRERDQAVMARLRLANEERDEALLRAKKLQQAAIELESINPEENDMDLEELLNRVNSADSALGIERSGVAILERLQKAKERRAKITAEEMRTVMEERDSALTRCKRLEQDLLHAQEQGQTSANNARHLPAENNQDRVRKEEFDAIHRDRDKALELCQKMEEELQTLRLFHSQHLMQAEETAVKEQGAPTPASPLTSEPKGGQNQALLSRMQLLASEHQNLQAQLRRSQDSEREASEKVQKLERLVEVLRKKVGTGSVRTVI
ncbi:mirror-image polydactyly gene 1 protein isoform X2 [Sardina pilchardus]